MMVMLQLHAPPEPLVQVPVVPDPGLLTDV
jgi:hypothetical protein